jgi:hypothetical protein
VGDAEGLEDEHRCQQHPEDHADAQLRSGDAVASGGDDRPHDGRGEQHPEGEQGHHRARRDELLGHEVRGSPGGGHQEQEQVDAETAEEDGHASIVGPLDTQDKTAVS